MQKIEYEKGARLIGLLILITSVVHWRNFMLIGLIVRGDYYSSILAVILLVLSLTSAIGLIMLRRWGFLAFYPLVLVITIFFSTSLIPFVTKLFPVTIRPWVMIAINVLLLAIVILIQREHTTSRCTEDKSV